jgi:glycerol uptake facilitator-like aquaporin
MGTHVAVAPIDRELVGTFWLVLGGCGSAVLAAAFPGLAGSIPSR